MPTCTVSEQYYSIRLADCTHPPTHLTCLPAPLPPTTQVLRTTPFRGSRINFVPTHYWMDKNRDGRVDSFCYMNQFREDGTGECLPFDDAAIADFR
jgi:hypothetical protein